MNTKILKPTKFERCEMKTNCQCSDPLCPVCHGKCTTRATTVVQRIDMEDRTGTPVCEKCADDCMESGLFNLSPWLKRFWK